MAATRTILLLDDSPTIRQLIKIFLMGQPYEFLEAETGEAGLALLEGHLVHLILADFRMPGMDGLAFLQRLRSHPRPEMREIPVVLLTADRSPTLRADGMAAGANEVLKKPVSGPDVLGVVSRYLEMPARSP